MIRDDDDRARLKVWRWEATRYGRKAAAWATDARIYDCVGWTDQPDIAYKHARRACNAAIRIRRLLHDSPEEWEPGDHDDHCTCNDCIAEHAAQQEQAIEDEVGHDWGAK